MYCIFIVFKCSFISIFPCIPHDNFSDTNNVHFFVLWLFCSICRFLYEYLCLFALVLPVLMHKIIRKKNQKTQWIFAAKWIWKNSKRYDENAWEGGKNDAKGGTKNTGLTSEWNWFGFFSTYHRQPTHPLTNSLNYTQQSAWLKFLHFAVIAHHYRYYCCWFLYLKQNHYILPVHMFVKCLAIYRIKLNELIIKNKCIF